MKKVEVFTLGMMWRIRNPLQRHRKEKKQIYKELLKE